jgi:uncharacterized protein YndB with AHSA1/START domain
MGQRSIGAIWQVAFAALIAVAAAPAAGEVTKTHPMGFIVRHEVVVEADAKQTWLALINPDRWWRGEHTWTGDAANLTLTPRGGGCFCERIPEVDEPARFTLEGSVEHMRVLHAFPERALRMRGGLGPLQSEPADGVLTITLSQVDGGTRVVWEYNVAGYMRYEIPVIARSVDGVIGGQVAALAGLLGRIDASAAPPPDKDDDDKPAPLGKPAAPAKPPLRRVEDAFGDLAGQ